MDIGGEGGGGEAHRMVLAKHKDNTNNTDKSSDLYPKIGLQIRKYPMSVIFTSFVRCVFGFCVISVVTQSFPSSCTQDRWL